jgi:hypothetical protein
VLDLPGIIEGASSGRGRGRQVVAVAKVRLFPFILPLIIADALSFADGGLGHCTPASYFVFPLPSLNALPPRR